MSIKYMVYASVRSDITSEVDVDKIKFREFRLRAKIKPGLTLTREDIDRIREKREQGA